MHPQPRGQVALLIDFENFIYGLSEQYGEQMADQVDPEVLFKLAEEYGQVVLANAYADWRFREVNQFQADLYRLGIELMHVIGKQQGSRFKNAVDVKMAVDAVEILWTLPHVKTFVIVSGDRDFIHVLKTLRRYGKTIVGVSPAQSVSSDFAALCDRFVRYGALAEALSEKPPASSSAAPETDRLRPVRDALRSIMAERPSGLKGAQIKPLLRRKLSATFDESEYGFTRLSDLLLALPEVVRVVPDANGGDLSVFPPEDGLVSPTPSAGSTASTSDLLIHRASLRDYRFERSARLRRAILEALFGIMKRREPFSISGVLEQMLEENEQMPISLSILNKYFAVFWQSRILVIGPNQQAMPMRERQLRLDPALQSPEDLTFRYEASITYKLLNAAREMGMRLEAALLADVLGLIQYEDKIGYCEQLLEFASRQNGGGGAAA